MSSVMSSSSAVVTSSSSYFWPQSSRSSTSAAAAAGASSQCGLSGTAYVQLPTTIPRPSLHQSLTLPRHHSAMPARTSFSSASATSPPPHSDTTTTTTASVLPTRNPAYVAKQPNGNRYQGEAVGKSSTFHIRQQHLQPQPITQQRAQYHQQQQQRVANGADLNYSGCSTVIV